MSSFKISIYFFIIIENIISEFVFCSDEDVTSDIKPASIVGGYRTNELQRTVIAYTSKMSYDKYLVSLRNEETASTFGYQHFCGGVILGEKLVLTAAHCVKDEEEIVPASSINVVAKTPSRLQRSLETEVLKVREIVVHEDFSWIENNNDIALLKLKKPIILDNKWAAAITLPDKRIEQPALCTVLGWGKLYVFGPLANKLLYLNVTLHRQDFCKTVIYNFEDTKLCASDLIDNNPCVGDSGSPLICDGILAGIVSYGNILCVGRPTVYTNVYAYMQWIRANAAEAFNNVDMHFRIIMALVAVNIFLK